MTRISRLDRSQLASEMVALYDNAFARCGNVPNIFRAMEPVKPDEGGCAA